jgi:HEPN domain-containing protein
MKKPGQESLRWALQAKDDHRFVNWVKSEGQFFDKGCFIAQQAGEKILKACLYALGQRRVFGHSLFEMATELSRHDERFASIFPSAKRLDRFYITTRYPNGVPGGSPFQLFEQEDLENALKDLDTVFHMSELFLGEKGTFL